MYDSYICLVLYSYVYYTKFKKNYLYNLSWDFFREHRAYMSSAVYMFKNVEIKRSKFSNACCCTPGEGKPIRQLKKLNQYWLIKLL